jgi:hypothetical protein
MARYRHPRIDPDADAPAQFAVDLGSERVVLDSDGCFESDDEAAVRKLAAAYDTDVASIRVDGDTDDAEVCGVELSTGGTCDRPADECPYHGD